MKNGMKILLLGRGKRWPWHVRRKTTFANIHVKNMTHVTELELNTRAFAPPFAHIPFIPVARTKECQECAHILLQVGSNKGDFCCACALKKSNSVKKPFQSLLERGKEVRLRGRHCRWLFIKFPMLFAG